MLLPFSLVFVLRNVVDVFQQFRLSCCLCFETGTNKRKCRIVEERGLFFVEFTCFCYSSEMNSETQMSHDRKQVMNAVMWHSFVTWKTKLEVSAATSGRCVRRLVAMLQSNLKLIITSVYISEFVYSASCLRLLTSNGSAVPAFNHHFTICASVQLKCTVEVF
jgi:hypothetical protein